MAEAYDAAKTTKRPSTFEIGEVVQLKGSLYKVTLFDAFTSNVTLKLISPDEASFLKEQNARDEG